MYFENSTIVVTQQRRQRKLLKKKKNNGIAEIKIMLVKLQEIFKFIELLFSTNIKYEY